MVWDSGCNVNVARRVLSSTDIKERTMAKSSVLAIFALLGTVALDAQQTPIYQVTVIERTVKAVDYQYRNGPTRVDFRGTVLLPHAKGDATVESKAGRTEIAARLEHIQPATRYGP